MSHLPAVQFMGDASYSIYLWHWPLIILLTTTTDLHVLVRALVVIPLTVVLAGLTKRCVEDPCRRAGGAWRKPTVAFVSMLVAVGMLVGIRTTQISAVQAEVERRQSEIASVLQDSTNPVADKKELAQEEPISCVGAQTVLNDCETPYAYTSGIDPAFAEADRPSFWYGTGEGGQHCSAKTIGTWSERSCDFLSDQRDGGRQAVLIGDSHAEHIFAPLRA
ncbi:acyltransferase [Pseudoclavibacter sp. 13-3]|nr:acyltransferase [Pseudoclavibacter sp. 13-3]MCD7100855.1 acyltransferase [Pseudoclavibacter sp. 13-3]